MGHVSKIVSILLSKVSDCPNTDTSLCYCNNPFLTEKLVYINSEAQEKVTYSNAVHVYREGKKEEECKQVTVRFKYITPDDSQLNTGIRHMVRRRAASTYICMHITAELRMAKGAAHPRQIKLSCWLQFS